jgi:peptidyl-prolyl cis-trans isomerase SurA
MRFRRTFRTSFARALWRRLAVCVAATALASAQTPQSNAFVTLDRVVAVVNNRAILSSDLEEEMRLSVLEPNAAAGLVETPQAALQRLISRSIIRQQIREEDLEAAEPTPDEISQRITTLRRELPICVRENCATDAGWNAFLEAHGLTQQRAENYLRGRLEILRFIEMRFRQGIRIPQEEIQTYYDRTLVPQYPVGQKAPTLVEVAPRIEEILLQQKVSALFSGWLENLRKQGDVEVLDPTLEADASTTAAGAGAQ